MLTFLKITFFFLLTVLLILAIWGQFYKNNHKLMILMGKKGSGKTTLSARFAIRHQLKGLPVFSDQPLYGCYKLEKNWCGRNDFPDDSLIIFDEGMLDFDNRKFKSFEDDLRNFFVMQRHDRVSVIVLCQDFNLVDKKIRSLTDSIFVCVNYFNVLTIAKKVHKGIALATDSEGQGSIGDSYTWEFPTSWLFCFIPRWVHFFNSFRTDPKPKVPLIKYEFINEPELERLTQNRYWYLKVMNTISHFIKGEISFFWITDQIYWIQNLNPSLTEFNARSFGSW